MIHIAFDTTAFHQDPLRKSPDWSLVGRLEQHGKLSLYIPEMVCREFTTSRQAQLRSTVSQIKKSLAELQRLLGSSIESDTLRAQIASFESRAEAVESDFQAWLGSMNFKILPIENHHGIAAINAYFSGTTPFSEVKSRKDFPDAFVYQAVIGLAQKLSPEPINFVTNDKHLGKSMGQIDSIAVSDRLAQVTERLQLSQVLDRTNGIKSFPIFANSEQFASTRELITEAIENQLAGEGVSGMAEESEATIEMYGPVEDLVLDLENLSDFGEGIIVIPFAANSDCVVGYFIQKSEYFEREISGSFEDWNDHVFRVEEEMQLAITGRISLEIKESEFNEDMDPKHWCSLLDGVDVSVDVDEIEVYDEAT